MHYSNIAENQITAGTKKSNKDYSFDEEHNPKVPSQMWFQESDEGEILFVVFYSQACRWSQCISCNLPAKMSKKHIDYRCLMAQIDYVFNQPDVMSRHKSINKVIVSNNGSVLDEATFSSTALIYLIAKLNICLPNLKVLSLETRPEYVDVEELGFISRALKEGDTPTDLELAIGFEAFDEHIRNAIFKKGLDLRVFESLCKKIAAHNFKLKCYLMQKPVPGMSDEEAIADVKQAIDYLSLQSQKHGIRINLHLNPTYAAYGTVLEKSFRRGEYNPPLLRDVARAVLYGKGKNITIFLGLCDEDMACDGGSFIRRGDKKIVEGLEKFNKTQDYNLLAQLVT